MARHFGLGGILHAGDPVVYSNGEGDIRAHVVAVPKVHPGAAPGCVPVVYDDDPNQEVHIVSEDDVY